MNAPKNPPQTYQAIMESETKRKSSVVYREQSGQYVDGEISRLVELSTQELARIADGFDRIALTDTSAVKVKALEYLNACADASTIPAIGGLCRALGYSLEGMRQFRIAHPNHPTTEFLELFRDLCSDLLTDAALRNLTNSVYSIFIQKARNGLRDSLTIETVTPAPDPLGAQRDVDQLATYLDVLEEVED